VRNRFLTRPDRISSARFNMGYVPRRSTPSATPVEQPAPHGVGIETEDLANMCKCEGIVGPVSSDPRPDLCEVLPRPAPSHANGGVQRRDRILEHSQREPCLGFERFWTRTADS
jgi:hypothetical protein